MNATQTIAKCSAILAGDDWLGGPEQHEQADEALNALITELYANHKLDAVNDALDALEASYRRTIVIDRLNLIAATDTINEMEILEVDEDELQTMIDSGHAQELSKLEAQKIIKEVQKNG